MMIDQHSAMANDITLQKVQRSPMCSSSLLLLLPPTERNEKLWLYTA